MLLDLTRRNQKQLGKIQLSAFWHSYGKGGGGGGVGMEEKLEILKKILGPPQKLYAFSRPPLMHFILFKDPPLVPLENIVLY